MQVSKQGKKESIRKGLKTTVCASLEHADKIAARHGAVQRWASPIIYVYYNSALEEVAIWYKALGIIDTFDPFKGKGELGSGEILVPIAGGEA